MAGECLKGLGRLADRSGKRAKLPPKSKKNHQEITFLVVNGGVRGI